MENWNNFLTEARDFPSLIHSLAGTRANIHTIGMMTAENPMAVKASPEENTKFNSELESSLRASNLGYRKIRGSFGSQENSYLIPNISKDEILALGKAFKQESVIWGERQDDKFVFEYIECATGQTTNTRDVVLFDSDVQSREDYYSQSKKGTEKFVIPFFDDKYEMVSEYNMSNPDYNGPLSEQISERVKLVLQPNRTGKSKWYNRGVIKELTKKTWQ